MPENSKRSLQGKVATVSNKIAFAKSVEKKELAVEELRKLIGLMCVSHGIKELPDGASVLIMLKTWNEKFSAFMNQQELQLAFELNMVGDLRHEFNDKQIDRIEHYQCFSVEFFAGVCNAYLKKRSEINTKIVPAEEKQEALPQGNIAKTVLEAILYDFMALHGSNPTGNTSRLPMALKVEYLNIITTIKTTVENIARLRPIAVSNVIRSLSAKRNNINHREMKFGAVTAITHQIARLTTDKLITQGDEDLIQAEVSSLLYFETLESWSPLKNEPIEECEFVKHVKENISRT